MMSLRKAVARALLLRAYEQFPLGSPLRGTSPLRERVGLEEAKKSRPEGRLSCSSYCLAPKRSNQNLCCTPTSNMVEVQSPVQPSPLFLATSV
jgi:hypothetical protein